MAFPLAPLLIGVLPEIGRHLFGRTGEVVAQSAAHVVREVVGTDEPDAVADALADPGKLDELRVRLAEVAAKAEADARRADVEELASIMADRADARQMARSGNLFGWGAVSVTAGSFLLLAVLIAALVLSEVPKDNREALNILLGIVGTSFIASVQFWVGSSAGSAGKSGLLGGTLIQERK